MLRVLLVLALLGWLTGHAGAQERDWLLDVGSEEAYLIFGVPDTDDVGVSLWCPLNKGIVNLYLPRPANEFKDIKARDVPLKVIAGWEKVTFRGKLDAPPDTAMAVIELEIPATHPLIAAMPSADRLTIQLGKHTLVFPIYGADVSGLIKLCRKR
jgi:hypothetical protein